MTAIPLPLGSNPGYKPQESAGRLINCFAEALGEGRNDGAKRVRVPGLSNWLRTTEAGPVRGFLLVGGTLYFAVKDKLLSRTGSTVTTIGDLPGTMPVYFARNGRTSVTPTPGPDITLVTNDPGTPGAKRIVGGAIVPYGDAELPQPNSVCVIDGYFVWTIGDGRIFASDLNDIGVNGLSFGTADTRPDRPLRPIPFSGRLIIFGEQTTEFWTDIGAVPFPFQRSSVISVGLIGQDAVAGWEDGFSAGLLWVADDGTVRMLDGYTPTKVSTPDLDRLINREPNKAGLLASVYTVDGHPLWNITGTSFTWSYDLSTKKWHERASWLSNRWRCTLSIRAFDKWLMGDRDAGVIFSIDPAAFDELGDPLPMRIESAPVEKFPQRIRVPRADFHCDTGVGITTRNKAQPILGVTNGVPHIRITIADDSSMQEGDTVQITGVGGTTEANGSWSAHVIGNGVVELIGSTFVNAYTSGGTFTEVTARIPMQTHPVMMISWSDDGGVNWGNPLVREMGPEAVDRNISVFRTGMSSRHGRRWRIDISDAVYVAIFSGDQGAEMRAP